MRGTKARELRRTAHRICDPTQNKQLVRRYKAKQVTINPETGSFEETTIFKDTFFWPEGSFRRVYQDSKHG